MQKKNVLSKDYVSQNEIFADAFNYYLYHGKEVIRADTLMERDVTELALPYGEDKAVISGEKMRDILRECVLKSTDKADYLLLGIENQSHIHYAMPVRNMVYDALNYAAQVADVGRYHRKKKDLDAGAEYLSGFTKKDKLKPIITLVIYWGADEWDAPRSLHEMMDTTDKEILKYVGDYSLNLIAPGEITDFNKFHSNLRYALEFISVSEEPDKLRKLLQKEAYSHMDIDTVNVINVFTNAKIKIKEEKGEVNMCLGIQAMIDEATEKATQKATEITRKNILFSLVYDGDLPLEKAAMRAGISEDDFLQEMKRAGFEKH